MKLKKAFALLLVLALTLTAALPSFPVAAETAETYDTVDELTLSDLGLDPGNFNKVLAPGGHPYSAHSSSHSVVLKFDWKVGALTMDGFCIGLDGEYRHGDAGVWIRSDGIYFCYMNEDIKSGTTQFSPITEGTHSVEFGRKLVTSGTHKGAYYIYFSVDGTVLGSGYTTLYTKSSYNDGNGMHNIIYIRANDLATQRFADAEKVPDVFDTADVFTLSDMGYVPGNFTNELARCEYTYTGTSDSHSVAVKFQWEAHDLTEAGWFISLEKDYSFVSGVWFRSDHIIFCYQSDVEQSIAPITYGRHEVEFGRKLVTEGSNAGLYKVYLNIDGNQAAAGYTSMFTATGYNDGKGMNNTIYVNGGELALQRFADAGPDPETYESFDEIGFNDLYTGGVSVAGKTVSGTHVYTYDRTSPTYSAVLRYRYTVGTAMGIQFSFDTTGSDSDVSWPFGVWVKNPNDNGAGIYGAWHLNATAAETLTDMTALVSQGDSFDIELGRLKVKTGDNAGKYYVYLKVNDRPISSYYYDGVNKDGTYNTTQLSNKIIIADWNDTKAAFSAVPKPVPESARTDLNGDGYTNSFDLILLREFLLGLSTQEKSKADFNADGFVDVRDVVAMKKHLISVLSDLRWQIVEPKRLIETTRMEGHSENLEMSGEQVSGIVNYAVQGGQLSRTVDLVFPSFRIQPNNTGGSYVLYNNASPGLVGNETFDKAQLSGILTLYSHTDKATVKRRFYPSTTLPCFYEDVEITATANGVTPVFEETKRLATKLGCAGYIYVDRLADKAPKTLNAGDTFRVIFTYGAHFANEEMPTETEALEKRLARVEELLNECDLTTGNDVIDTEFAFAKIRAGESLFRTQNGLVHCPGGYSYYAAVWCNDQLEYAAPWFAYTGDAKAMEATENAFRWYEPYMNDNYSPIPSSIIAEGNDYWNGAGDRGDAAMYLFGLSRYLLTTGKAPDAGQQKALEWCMEYINRQIMEDGAVYSDSDELENRISSGVNLSTTSLAYGGLGLVAQLWQKYEKTDLFQKATTMRKKIEPAFENHFGANLKGYKTYAYHQGCTDIRAWNCLPVYMGVTARAEDTLQSIFDKLWQDDSCRTTEGENVMWDRSALYFMASMFRADKTEQAFSMLESYSQRRLLGERVPYPIEAYPEGNMRHLSGESALYCRVITDGLLNIASNGDTYSYRESIPFIKGEISLKNVYINGEYRDIVIR